MGFAFVLTLRAHALAVVARAHVLSNDTVLNCTFSCPSPNPTAHPTRRCAAANEVSKRSCLALQHSTPSEGEKARRQLQRSQKPEDVGAQWGAELSAETMRWARGDRILSPHFWAPASRPSAPNL